MNDSSTAPISASHISIEHLAAYHAGVLPEAEAERIRSHFLHCSECAELILELTEFAEDASTVDLSEFERAAAWRQQRKRLVKSSVLPSTTPNWRHANSPIWGWVAATLVAIVSTLSIDSLRDQISELEAPQVGLSLVNLEPLGAVREMNTSIPILNLPTETRRGWVILYPEDPGEHSVYRIELFDADDRLIKAFNDVEESNGGTIRLEVSRLLLPPGLCRLIVFDQRAENPEALGEFHLKVSYE